LCSEQTDIFIVAIISGGSHQATALVLRNGYVLKRSPAIEGNSLNISQALMDVFAI